MLVELGNEGLIHFFLSAQVSAEKSSSSLRQCSLPEFGDHLRTLQAVGVLSKLGYIQNPFLQICGEG
jgi:hypothetical protein